MKKLILFFIIVQCTFSQGVTLKELNNLKKSNLLTIDEYNIMITELKKTLNPTKKIYTLYINNNIYDKMFDSIEYKEKVYINVNKFLELLNIKYSIKDNHLIYYLNYSYSNGKKYSINLKNKENVLIKNNNIYIQEKTFEKMFCRSLSIKRDIININISFLTTEELNKRLNILEKRNRTKEIYSYRNKNDLINLGTIEPIFYKNLSNSEWSGNLKYYSDLLYGSLETNYNIKNKNFDKISLNYDSILENHEVKFYKERNFIGDNYGFSIEKNDGYISKGNTTYIKENVPLGSRVELFFLGKLIQVQSENNGKVYFYGPLIKRGYIYSLKVHTSSGGVYTKIINIVDDYNLQQKNQYDYNFKFEKNIESQEKYENGEFYYGLNDHLTLGIKNKYYQNNHYIGENLIYGNNFSNSSYIINFENLQNTSNKKEYLRKIEGKFNYKSFENKFDFEKNNSSLSYINNLREFETRYYITPEHNSYIGLVSQKKNNKNYFSPKYNINIPVKNYFYNISGTKSEIENTITTSYKNCFLSLNGSYNKDDKNFKTSFDIMSIYSHPFDYDFEVSYSKQKKELFTFKFTLNYNNWLKFKTYFNNNTNKYNSSIRIDKYIDLKNLSAQNLNSVKVIPFLDENKNGKKDKNEKFFNNVFVEMNGEKHIILNDKPIYFNNIGMNMKYIMNITIRSYGYKVKHSKMNIFKNSNQVMTVYIPVEEILNQ